MVLRSENDTLVGRRVLEVGANERWYVVHSLPHRETQAQLQLENQRYRVFLPKREKTLRHARRLRTI